MKKDVEHRHSADRKKRAPADAGRYAERRFTQIGGTSNS